MNASDKDLAQNVLKVTMARRLLGEVFVTEPAEETRNTVMPVLRVFELQLQERLKKATKREIRKNEQ